MLKMSGLQYHLFITSTFLPPAKEVWGNVIFSQASVCPQGGLCMMSLPAQGGLCPVAVSVGVGSLCPGVSDQGVSDQWGLCQGGLCPETPQNGKERAVRILLDCNLVMNYSS